MELLNSMKIKIGFTKKNPTILETKVSNSFPKEFLDQPTVIPEEVLATNSEYLNNNSRSVNNNNSNNNNNRSSTEIVGELEMKTFGHSRSAIPLSHTREIRTGVTCKLLKKILTSQKKTEKTETLQLRGVGMAAIEVLNAKRMRLLESQCPSLANLVLSNFNLCTPREKRKLRLRDFRANLESLSLQESAVEPSTFFAGVNGSAMRGLRVLDLSRVVFIEGGRSSSINAWPQLENLRELYLAGVLQGRSASSLEKLLQCFPNLEVLDLESAELKQDDLVTISRLLFAVRELYLGQTGLKDAAIIRMAQAECSLLRLETICLAQTDVTDIGLTYFMRACRNLRSITCKRSIVPLKEASTLELSVLGLGLKRVELTHTFSVFRDRCCDFFNSIPLY